MICSKWKTCRTKTEEVDIAPVMKQEVSEHVLAPFVGVYLGNTVKTWPRGYKTFFHAQLN